MQPHRFSVTPPRRSLLVACAAGSLLIGTTLLGCGGDDGPGDGPLTPTVTGVDEPTAPTSPDPVAPDDPAEGPEQVIPQPQRPSDNDPTPHPGLPGPEPGQEPHDEPTGDGDVTP